MKRPVSYVVIAGTVLIGILSPFLLAKQYRLIDPNGRVILYATTNLEDVSSPTATAPSILPYCSREQVQQGFWTYNHTQPLRYRSTPWEETCYKNGNGYYPTQWNVDDSCQLVEWDPAILCEVLEHKTLGFIGDSISWQIFRSLVGTFFSVIKSYCRRNALFLTFLDVEIPFECGTHRRAQSIGRIQVLSEHNHLLESQQQISTRRCSTNDESVSTRYPSCQSWSLV